MSNEATIIVPLKLYDKNKQIKFENYLLKYLKFYAHEDYSIDLL